MEPNGNAEGPKSSQTSAPKASSAYGVALPQVTPGNVNEFSGGSVNTASEKPKEASVIDALKSLKLNDIREFHNKPCVRDALMTGIGAGFGVGGIRAVLGATVMRACNWAVATFCFGSVLTYEYCQRKRLLEQQGMKRAVEVMERKRAEKQMLAAKAKIVRENKEQ